MVNYIKTFKFITTKISDLDVKKFKLINKYNKN